LGYIDRKVLNMAEIRVCISRSKIKYIEKINDEIKELLEEKKVEGELRISFSIMKEYDFAEACIVSTENEQYVYHRTYGECWDDYVHCYYSPHGISPNEISYAKCDNCAKTYNLLCKIEDIIKKYSHKE